MNAATRVFYALSRNGLAPAAARPHALEVQDAARRDHLDDDLRDRCSSLLIGWKWGALVGFALIATLAVPLVILVYMMICVGCMRMYTTKMRSQFNPFLHIVLPIAGIVLFFFPLYYQFYKAPPTKPILYANWIAIAWTVAGIILTVLVVQFRPQHARGRRPRLRRGRDRRTATRRPRLRADGMMVAWR